ncbi:hypothetical protein JCM12296A_59910 [Desulfosarcina cetonica]|uniref:hypothetical protein n=1 Tax=Desulfosarcina cetonica TaxID=90730 RepID=UPI0006D25AFE|nr:hypothetical protein [Desulfosarcina cetonica]
MNRKKQAQMQLFDFNPANILGVAYSTGVDSRELLVGLHSRSIMPDFILFADVSAEKGETYLYLPIIQSWLK